MTLAPLPKQTAPVFMCKLPSTGKEIIYRPYTVKEEKILLIALESQDDKEIALALRQIVTNCIVSENLDIGEFPIYDYEYLMLKIRSKSADNKIEIRFKGRQGTECEKCKKDKAIELDLDEVEVYCTPGHTNKIMLSETLGITLKEPTLKESQKYELSDKNIENANIESNLICDCLESIFTNDEMFNAKLYTTEQLTEFVDGLTQEQYKKIKNFFHTMPVLKKTLDLSCKDCGFKEEYILQRLQDFFA